MKIQNPKELVGKEVHDQKGTLVGIIDKMWNSWNQDYPGYFFGIRPSETTRYTWFRGTTKLIPIYSDYIREYGETVHLNKTVEQLGQYWNKTVHVGQSLSWPMDELVEMPVYDREYCRVGTFYAWVEHDGAYKNYGVFLDPYLSETWHVPPNTLMPLPTENITYVKDTIWLNKTLAEMHSYWQQYYHQ